MYLIGALIVAANLVLIWNVRTPLSDVHFQFMPRWFFGTLYAFGAVPVILRSQFFQGKPLFFYDTLLVVIPFLCALGLIRFKNLARILIIVFCWMNVAYVAWQFFPGVSRQLQTGVFERNFWLVRARDLALIFAVSFSYIMYLTYPTVRWRYVRRRGDQGRKM